MENFLKGYLSLEKNVRGEQTQVIPLDEKSCEAALSQTPTEPRVELLSRDGVVKTIIITCSCGKRIELKCDY